VEDIDTEIAVLEAKLAARKGRPGWDANCKAIEARLKELRGE